MRISEIIQETGSIPPKIMATDELGGFIKISPNPDLVPVDYKFSIAYINHNMAKFYGVLPRIIGYDTTGHNGLYEPHLHVFQKSKSKGYLMSPKNIPKELPYSEINKLFMEWYAIVTTKYERDINEKN